MNTVPVVTRYGGYRHLADTAAQSADGRFHTLCNGVSSWTLSSWARFPDHPYLTLEEMSALPECPACARVVSVTPRHTVRHFTISVDQKAGDPVYRLCEPNVEYPAQWDSGAAPADVPTCAACVEAVMWWVNFREDGPLLLRMVRERGKG